MNFSFVQVLAGSIGALLIYAAVKDQTPVAIIQGAMGQKPVTTDHSGGGDFASPSMHGWSSDVPPAPVQQRPGGTPIYVRPNAGPF